MDPTRPSNGDPTEVSTSWPQSPNPANPPSLPSLPSCMVPRWADGAATEEPQSDITAEGFVARLAEHASESVRQQLRPYIETSPPVGAERPDDPHGTISCSVRHSAPGQPSCPASWAGPRPRARVLLGVPIGQVFLVARRFVELPLGELDRLLDREEHEVRAGAVFVMSEQARARWAPRRRRHRLYLLYLRRLDRIDNWDLVDVGAPHVVGGYLSESDEPRHVLYALAGSTNRWARRTALLAALRLVRDGDLDDACALSQKLLDDPEEVVQKPVGGVLREVGKVQPPRLSDFLRRHADRIPPAALRYAVQPLDVRQRIHYLGAR